MAVKHTNHKDLIVYRKSKSLALDLIRIFSKKKFPKIYEFVILQLLRSVTSICANIVEGYGRHYRKSFRQFLSIARGSCFETEYWLEII